MKAIKFFFMLCLLFAIPTVVLADEDCDPGDPGGCGVCDTCSVPIDEWLAVLLAAGALYGFVKYRKEQKMVTK